ncbi:MAG: MarR family transcriptional regulator [Bacteroidia bacterium]|nr:MarR family transcriptional regulator [Bacteroidia bacterium]
MSLKKEINIPIGTKALILSKFYFGVLSKSLENIDAERYFSILYFLNDNNGCTQQCICNNLAVDKTAMVKVIDYLIKADLVERDINPNDRREHFIKLTKKGQKQTEEVVKAFSAIDKEMFTNVSKDDQETFTRVLSQLSSNLKNLPSNDLFFNYKKTARKKRLTTIKAH